jgi:hypothetical protein
MRTFSTSRTYRGATYYVRHAIGDDRADVDVFDNTTPFHDSFSLAVIRPDDPKRGPRLVATVEAWIDGLRNMQAAA